MWPSEKQIEAIGKVGGGIVAVIALAWVLYAAINSNMTLTAALSAQIELAEKQTTLAERQTQALEKLVQIYSGQGK